MEELKYFLCYVRTDSEFVLRLAKELRAVGANVWLDRLDILGGQHWDSTVEQALKSCKGMIAVLSPEAVASNNVMDEVSYALNEGKLVVPVLLRSCDIPFRLQRVQYIDFTADYATGFSQLLRALGIQQPSLPQQSESTIGEQKPAEVRNKSRIAKVLGAICIVALITIISIGVFLKYLRPKTYSLDTPPPAVGGSVEKSPDKASYKHGETVTLRAVPNTEYNFINWSGDLSGSTNPTTLVMNADKSMTAKFVLKTYSLTATAVGGSVEKSPDKTRYKHGETVTLKAAGNTAYNFTNWSGDLSGDSNPATLVMDADKSVTAHFAVAACTITASAGPGGAISPSGAVLVNAGADQTFTITPDTGYSVSDVVVDGSSVGAVANHTVTNVTADHTIAASFALKTYSLTATAVGGSVEKRPDKTSYKHDETVTLEAVPNKGYRFTNWSGDLSGDANPTTLVAHTDMSVTARFVLLKAGDVATNSIGMKLVYIPPGSFMMGSSRSAGQLAREYDADEQWVTNEFPQHQVRISEGFWMGQTEVTQGQYKSVMRDKPWSGDNVQESANNPAVYMSWDNANDFCRKLSEQEGKTYRLPTEAEWEYACRAGTKTAYFFGDDPSKLTDYAWFEKNSGSRSRPVGQKPPNPWGMYDLHGNVCEWCSDYYDPNWYAVSPSVDPVGPAIPIQYQTKRNGNSFPFTPRSVRGAGWDYREKSLRCSSRSYRNPDLGYANVGFRVVRELLLKPFQEVVGVSEPSAGDARREAEELVSRLMRALRIEDVDTLVQLSPPPLCVEMKVLTSVPDIREMYQGYYENDKALREHGRVYVDRVMSGTIREYRDLGHLEEDDPILSQMPLDDDDIVVIVTGHHEDGTDVRGFFYFRRLDGRVIMAGLRQASPPIKGPESPP